MGKTAFNIPIAIPITANDDTYAPSVNTYSNQKLLN